MRHTEEGRARVGGVDLAYDEIGPEDGEPMLMVMGLATQMIAWDEDFCAMLAERGFRVIRFDNRDVGHSTLLASAGVPSRLSMMLGTGRSAYRLEDLADDAAGLLDRLEIESAHVVGASMGGMIAQQMAIDHPERVRSLASIMSGPGSRRTGTPRLRAFGALLRAAPHERDAFVENVVRTFNVIGSPGFERDEERLRRVAADSYDRGHSRAGVARQLHAITTSPNRTRALRRVTAPTVVIHGTDDPLVRVAAGRATARAIPGAELVLIEGMGHDLPRGVWPRVVDAITGNAARTGTGRVPAPAFSAAG